MLSDYSRAHFNNIVVSSSCKAETSKHLQLKSKRDDFGEYPEGRPSFFLGGGGGGGRSTL